MCLNKPNVSVQAAFHESWSIQVYVIVCVRFSFHLGVTGKCAHTWHRHNNNTKEVKQETKKPTLEGTDKLNSYNKTQNNSSNTDT